MINSMQREVLKTSLVLTYISIGFFSGFRVAKISQQNPKSTLYALTFRLGNWSTLGLFSKFICMIKSLNPVVFTFRLAAFHNFS